MKLISFVCIDNCFLFSKGKTFCEENEILLLHGEQIDNC